MEWNMEWNTICGYGNESGLWKGMKWEAETES